MHVKCVQNHSGFLFFKTAEGGEKNEAGAMIKTVSKILVGAKKAVYGLWNKK